MDETAILNYPGSKRKLLDFIYTNLAAYIPKDKEILDIFSGTGCVAQMFKEKGYLVKTNDSENYSCNIAYSILNGFEEEKFDKNKFFEKYEENYKKLSFVFRRELGEEAELINNESEQLETFDKALFKVWNKNDKGILLDNITIKNVEDLNKNINDIPFCLFTLYYAGSYFGLLQSIEIDSLRYAIEQTDNNREVLLTCLYYAMKEATFSKDGHMAQPLNHSKNQSRLFSVRKKKILDLFKKELSIFSGHSKPQTKSTISNKSFLDLLESPDALKNVCLIYADPPYTDMQYSRYFHLLTTVTNYAYPEMTIKGGKVTSGLYANNRFQSTISNRGKALSDLEVLIRKSAENGITLAFSYAFPIDRENQPTDRYTMNIDDLINKMKQYYKSVKVQKENYKHCNNRNSSSKKVYEYLIIGEAI